MTNETLALHSIESEVPADAALGLAVEVSSDAEHFAKSRGLWESLSVIRSLILLGDPRIVAAVDVTLISDAEVSDRFLIQFNIRTRRAVADVLTFDRNLQAAIYEKIAVELQSHFSVRFDFI
jgi:hypothetical protein